MTTTAGADHRHEPPSGGGAGRQPAVIVRGLAKRYDDRDALHPGAPDRWRATVAGPDVVAERDEVRRNIGLVFEDTTLDGYLSAEQNLRLHAELYGVPRALVADVGRGSAARAA